MLVFVPMLAAHAVNPATVLRSLGAFLALGCVASAVHIVTGLIELQAARLEPHGRDHPFASGRVSIVHGVWFATALLAAGLVIGMVLGPLFMGVLAVFAAAAAVYALDIKRRIVIDMCVLAGLLTVPILAGSAATGLAVSLWLLVFAVFFFVSLAAIRRQAELIANLDRGTPPEPDTGYHADDLPIVSHMAVSAGYASVLAMALYVNSDGVAALYAQPAALFGVCLILLYWISRMAMVAHRGGMHDNPALFAANDRTSQICGAMVLACAFAGLQL